MKDVARAAGVSVMTVSRALRHDAIVGEATRKRIGEVADRLGYVLDSTAANLRQQRTGFVAVTVPSINNANFADTVGGLSQILEQNGLQVLLGYTDYNLQREETLIEQLLRRRPEAIVVTGGRHTERASRLLGLSGIPVIETWDVPASPIGHVVGFSNAATTRMTVDHLVSRGCRRIAFIGGDTDGDSRGADRQRGFVESAAALGLDGSRLIGSGRTAPVSMREGAHAMAALLAAYPDTEAVICVSDLCAFGAATECQRRGISVPGEMAIAGFGNYEISEISVPSITTVDPFPATIGRLSAELIVSILRGETIGDGPERLLVEPVFRPRQSTGRDTCCTMRSVKT